MVAAALPSHAVKGVSVVMVGPCARSVLIAKRVNGIILIMCFGGICKSASWHLASCSQTA
jgi:hypothetical protein